VINLEATEVSPSSSESPPKPQDSADPAPPQQAAETSSPSEAKSADVPPEQVAFASPRSEPAAEAKSSEPQPSESAPQPAAEEMPPPAGSSRQSWTPVIAGLSGVGGGAVVVLLLWAFGALSSGQPVLPPQQASQPDLSPRLAGIEQQLKELAARPAPAAPDTRALTDIAARLGKLESAVAAPRLPVTDPVVLGRITAAENTAKSTADNVAGLTRRVDSLETALRDTNGQLQQLAVATAELQARVRETGAGADRPSRLAAVTAALRAAIERGEPFAAELAIEKSLGADASLVTALEPFAAAGVPSPAALGHELAAIIRPMLVTAEPPHDSTFLDKLQAHAEKLVKVRPIDEARGDDRIAVLTRIEQRAGKGDIAGALSEFSKLPPEVRARPELQAWAAKAEARGKAVEAARKLAADAVTALKPGP
jgi:hypothetical protein